MEKTLVAASGKKMKSISEEEIPFEVPNNWCWIPLDELGITQTGTTPSASKSVYLGNHIPFIKPAVVTPTGIDYSNEGLSKKGLELARMISAPAVIMVCIGGSIGKCFYTDRNISCNQQINTITPYLPEMQQYIYRVLSSQYFFEKIKEKAGGTATPIINKGQWISVLIPVPPLAEQERIVKRIEELFSAVDNLFKPQAA